MSIFAGVFERSLLALVIALDTRGFLAEHFPHQFRSRPPCGRAHLTVERRESIA